MLQHSANSGIYYDLHVSIQPEGAGWRYIWSSKDDPGDIWVQGYVVGTWERAEHLAHEHMGRYLYLQDQPSNVIRFPETQRPRRNRKLTIRINPPLSRQPVLVEFPK
jgi:hypothetical protein